MQAPGMGVETARALVQPYSDALLAATAALVHSLIEAVTSPDWRNCTDEPRARPAKRRSKRWSCHLSSHPELDLHIREVLVSGGNKLVVRGGMNGSLTQAPMGLDPHGRLFNIMTIDIHEISNEKIVHYEESLMRRRRVEVNALNK